MIDDANGIDIYFLCSPVYQQNIRTMQAVQQLFQQVRPLGEHTPTETRVEELLEPYVTACEQAKRNGQPVPKPMNLLVSLSQIYVFGKADGFVVRHGRSL